jgi:hypothetical protein
MEAYILNQSLDRLGVIDAINERIIKIKAIATCLLAASHHDEIDNENVTGAAWTIEDFISEIEMLFSLDKKGAN